MKPPMMKGRGGGSGSGSGGGGGKKGGGGGGGKKWFGCGGGHRGMMIKGKRVKRRREAVDERVSLNDLLPIDGSDTPTEEGSLVNINAWQHFLDERGSTEYCLGRLIWLINNGQSVTRMEEFMELSEHLTHTVVVERREDEIGRVDIPTLVETISRLREMQLANPEFADIYQPGVIQPIEQIIPPQYQHFLEENKDNADDNDDDDSDNNAAV